MRLILSIILPVFLGAVFVYAGVVKVMDPVGFYHDIVLYHLVDNNIAWIVAHYLPWLEVIAGIGVACSFSRISSSLILTVLLLIFMGAVSAAWFRGLKIECGCFGRPAGGGSYPLDLIRDFVLLLSAIYLATSRFLRSQPREP